jgi:hypothetical protein
MMGIVGHVDINSDVTGTWAWHEFENVLKRGMRVVAALISRLPLTPEHRRRSGW